MEKGGEMEEPCPGSLFEPVQGFVEAAHMVGKVGVHKSRGLGAIYCLSELTMQECILDIQLMYRP
jgi:hypothetical protein